MPSPFLQRMVNLEPRDYRAVQLFALRKGLGRRGFSAALRLIIREWEDRCSPLDQNLERIHASTRPAAGEE